MVPVDDNGPAGEDRPWTVVANPAAGRRRGARALALAETALAGAGIRPAVVVTRDLPHARAAAAEVARDEGIVVAAGGDGLIGAVAGELAGTQGVLGIVPAGRGNDFARSLGLPLDPAAASRLLAGARRRQV